MFHKKMRRRALRAVKNSTPRPYNPENNVWDCATRGSFPLPSMSPYSLPSESEISTVKGREQRASSLVTSRRLIASLISMDIPSRKTRLIKSQQLFPGTLSIRFVIDRLSVLHRHIGNAPTVLRLRIDFDLCHDLGSGE